MKRDIWRSASSKRYGSRGFIAIAMALWVASAAISVNAQEPFYKGKTIHFIVAYSAGGGFDTYTRLIARHFGKHVPGKPDTVVENMTGAGGFVAANYIYNRAKRDGTVIGNWMGALVLQQIMGNPGAQFDGRKFGWLGAPVTEHNVCALTKASGISRMDQWFASKRPIKLGGIGPGGALSDIARTLKAALGLPIQLVEPYKGTSRVRLAAEAGELDGGCWSWQSIKVTWRKGIDSGDVRVVVQAPLESHPELKDIPLAINYAKGAEAREFLKVVNDVHGASAKPYSVPPGIPDARLRILQNAFAETLRDPELLAEAEKSKLEISPVDGQSLAKKFAGVYDMDPGLLSSLTEILVPKK